MIWASPELGYCVAPHLSFVQFLSRAEHRWECCALEEERDVEPLRLCGRGVKRVSRRIWRGVKKVSRRIWRGIKRGATKVWRGVTSPVRWVTRKINQIGRIMRKSKKAMRLIRYYWAMFKATRSFIRRQKPAPDRSIALRHNHLSFKAKALQVLNALKQHERELKMEL